MIDPGADRRHMARALELARRGAGATSPNPMVGAVLVHGDTIIAEGHHEAPGRQHAEVAALRAVPDGAPPLSACTMYVNLEPCCHFGRTPPCADALIHAGVGRVVVGMVDPDPRVRGGGIARLRSAGVDVTVGVLEDEAIALNAAFAAPRTAGRPQVIAKAAITLDGRIADAWGHSQWITGPAARAEGHRLRDRVDAVMVGIGTLLADDPALTTRLADGAGRHALPVVLDGGLRCPPTARVLQGPRRPRIYARAPSPPAPLPADIRVVPDGPGGLDLTAVLADLHQAGVGSVLVEGGGRVHGSLLAAGLIDELHLFINPRALGGGPAWVGPPALPLASAPGYRLLLSRPLGDDLHLVLVRPPPAAAPAPPEIP